MSDFDRLRGAVLELVLDPAKPRGELRMGVIYRGRDGQDTMLATQTKIDRSHHITDNRLRPDNGLPATYDDMYEIAHEFGRAMLKHPFVKLSRCTSPIELDFYFHAYNKIAGLEPQYQIGEYWVDFAVPDRRVAIELDSHQYHHTDEQLAKDEKRRLEMEGWGWKVHSIKGPDIHNDLFACIEKAKAFVDAQPNAYW